MKRQLNCVAVLGASGQIGQLVVHELTSRGYNVLALSRWKSENSLTKVTWVPIDPFDAASLSTYISGCLSLISVVGLPYRADDWMILWPKITEAVIRATEYADTKLVWLDNAYAYKPTPGISLVETSEIGPVSKKGHARLQSWLLLERAIQSGRDMIVGRASDFIGPAIEMTVVPWSSFESALRPGGKLRWIGNPRSNHSYSYAPNVAAALVELAISTHALFSLYHLPVLDAISGNIIGEILTKLAGRQINVSEIPKWKISAASYFHRPAREQLEMSYITDNDFLFDDTRFRSEFITITKQSIAQIMESTLRKL